MNQEEHQKASVKDLEKMVTEKGIASYDPVCVRKRSNWSKGAKMYKFDDYKFNPETLLNDIPENSPKLNVLLKKIDDLDKKDMKKYGKKFKHFIFSDLKSSTYGAKLIAAALIAKGMKLGYNAEAKLSKEKAEKAEDDDEEEDEEMEGGAKEKKAKRWGKIELLSQQVLENNENNNFYLLSSVSVFDQPISTLMKKSILKTFNQRPENINGELARIIVMDSGFKEGIDLFDIKYIHIYEPSTVAADQKQVIGRGTRTCGQKGLDFHPTRGWPLYVFVYDLSIPEKIQGSFLGAKTAMELYLKAMSIDVRLLTFAHDLEKTSVFGSVDYELNKNIHSFSIPFVSADADDGEELNEHVPDDVDVLYNGGNSLTNLEKQVGGGPKRRLVIKDRAPIVIPSADETPRLKFNDMRQHIKDRYAEFEWTKVKMENMCADKQSGGSGQILKYTPTQDFVRNYFTPMNAVKGMLLWHSVGTGKTCSAIAAATNNFEKAGYTILWVTRTTLKNDIWKNMFDQVCNETIKHKIMHSGLEIPEQQDKRMKLLSNAWRIRPMSYKQFSNLVSKRNSLYDALVKINGKDDPLRKTLLIIDEAHKLYGGGDLSSIETPDMKALKQALMYSYQYSGINSVKLMLMTATPITQDPMELIKLINLCKPSTEQMPEDFTNFSDAYLDDNGEFTDMGRKQYLDDTSGYISYLNREKDARQFSQPQIQHINVPITNDIKMAEKFDKKIVREYLESDIGELKQKIVDESKELKGELGDLDKNKFNFLREDACGDLEGKEQKICNKVANKNIRELLAEAKQEVKDIRDRVKQIRNTIRERNSRRKDALKDIQENIQNYEEDYEKYKESLLYNIKSKCGKKITGKSGLNEYAKEDPIILKHDKQIEEYNEQIQGLHQQLKQQLVNYKIRIDHLKGILKRDLTDLERSVIKMTIRDDGRTHKNIMKLKRKEVTSAEKKIDKEIKDTQKKRKASMKNVRKTLKERIKKEKKIEKDIEKAEKKLRKSLRKERDHREEINHVVLNELVKKYQTNINEDLGRVIKENQDKIKEKLDMKDEKEKLKVQERKEKEEEKQKANKQKQEFKQLARDTKKKQKEEEKMRKAAAKEAARKTKKVKEK